MEGLAISFAGDGAKRWGSNALGSRSPRKIFRFVHANPRSRDYPTAVSDLEIHNVFAAVECLPARAPVALPDEDPDEDPF